MKLRNFKPYVKWVLAGVSLLLCIHFYRAYIKVSNDLSVAVNNNKAYCAENDSIAGSNLMFKMKADELEYYKDSITNEMDKVRKSLKIKDKNLSQMHYLLSDASRHDTLMFRDTLFKYPVDIDTVLKDEWYELKLDMRFPNTVIVNPKFVSEKYIIAHDRKETVKPPKKFFLFRWFQKKQRLVEVTVVEKNPYINDKKQKFIEIMK